MELERMVAKAAIAKSGSRQFALQAMAGPQIVLTWPRPATRKLRRLASKLSERLSSLEANLAQRDLLTLKIDLFPFDPLAERAWQLRHNLTIYDGWHVALAEALSCPLVTLDRRLARAPGPTCEIITPPSPRVVRERAVST